MDTADRRRTEQLEELLNKILTTGHVCRFEITTEEMFQLRDLNRTIQEAKRATRKRLVDAVCGALGVVVLYGLIEWLRKM